MSDLKFGAGCALIILAAITAPCLGIGGCVYLMKLGDAKLKEANRITITNSFNSIELKP